MKMILALALAAIVQLPTSSEPRTPAFRTFPVCPLAPSCSPGGTLSCDASCRCVCLYPTE